MQLITLRKCEAGFTHQSHVFKTSLNKNTIFKLRACELNVRHVEYSLQQHKSIVS